MLITTRISFLQQIQRAAINGCYHYVSGTVQPNKLQSLISKFHEKYQVNKTRQQAFRDRENGKASARFFVYADEDDHSGYQLFWVLLVTNGDHPAKQSESLKDLRLRKERFVYSDYQLIQKPRADGKQKFTYYLTTDALSFYTQRIRSVVRNKNRLEMKILITHLSKMPGFSGIREQRKKLTRIYRGELKKILKTAKRQNLPEIQNFYHRYVAVDWVKNIKVFVKQLEENNRTVKQQLKAYRDNKNKRGTPKVPLVSSRENDSIVVITLPVKPKSMFGKIFS